MKKFKTIFLALILLFVTAFSFTGCQHPGLYTVSFDSDGGSVVQNQYLKEVEIITIPYSPTKNGYEFVCWIDVATGKTFNFKSVKVTKNITLKATWLTNEGLDNFYYQFYDMDSYVILSVFDKLISQVNIPDTVSAIDRYVFSGCENLTKFVVNKNSKLKVIMNESFLNCSNLKSVVIPKSMTIIEGYSFYGCDKIEKVYYGGTMAGWNSFLIVREEKIDEDTTIVKGLISEGNESLLSATIYFYSASQPTGSGNYWRYVNGEPTPW
ncbi:MAG: leucine-rich repeat protein [Clostridia bacterium]|nr:leucine-rich repeat protein [Clostridia bacterium]